MTIAEPDIANGGTRPGKEGPRTQPIIADPFAARGRPVLTGAAGAVSAAHPLAVSAGLEMLNAGGSAVDATIAAQAVLCVVMPDSCGLGGDVFCLVRSSEGETIAVNGSGASAQEMSGAATDGGGSVTVPGLVDAWDQMAERWGRLPLARVLGPAIRLARGGMRLAPRLARALERQGARLLRGGAGSWSLLSAGPGEMVEQLDLANVLDKIAKEGAAAFYAGSLAEAIAAAVQAKAGRLSRADLEAHHTIFAMPIRTSWRGITVLTQPPMSQGILLSMALQALDRLGASADDRLDHVAIEATEAAFAYRNRVAEGVALLGADLPIDLETAARRGGPRAYLHTAGVAAADRFGMTVSSLASVFDDFGSGVWVAQGGFVLNNRAGGFTSASNEAAPSKRPVHTLAPIMVESPRGAIGFATPGADGQVQTLLQVLLGTFAGQTDLGHAVERPRWRSENGQLLIEADHPNIDALRERGHDVAVLAAGDMKFGAVVCAGHHDGAPISLADWRRETWAGVT